MLAPKKINRKKIIIYSLVIVIVLSTVTFLFYQEFSNKNILGDKSVSTANNLVIPSPIETTFGQKIFSNLLFKDLEMNGNLPVKIREQGRTNPFQEFLD